jgi:tripartite-type tricarboxylate transporter receptor subunit TctC
MITWGRIGLAGSVAVTLCSFDVAGAQPLADFYRGKTVNMLVGTAVGGEYDLFARLVARHIGRHIPGNPSVVVQNVVGAGGLKMLNYLYNQSPTDGTNLAIVQTGMPAAQAVGMAGIQFDLAKFNWLGSIAPAVPTMVVWHTSGATTMDDARQREIVVGAPSRQSDIYTFPAMMNEFVGTKFKIVTGYASGSAINLALERGEVAGRMIHWSTLKTTKPAWLKDKKITVLVRAGPKVPDLEALSVEDLARTPDDRLVIELLMSGSHIGRPFILTPRVPKERVAAMRAAFDATMKDKEFIAEAERINLEVAPIGGDTLQLIVEKIVSTPKGIAARAKHLVE